LRCGGGPPFPLFFPPACLSRHVDAIRNVPLVHAPMEEPEEYSNRIFLFEHPQILQLIILRHILEMVLEEVVNVLTEKVQIRLSEDASVGFGVDDELHEQHEKKVEWLETAPFYLGAHRPCKLEKTISDADISLRH